LGENREAVRCYKIFMVEPELLRYPSGLMQPAQLDIERQAGSNGELLVARLNGKLSLETVNVFISAMRPEPAARLVLDMSGLSFLDSAGVGALVSLFVNRRNNGKTLALAGLTQQGNAVMQVSGLLKLLPIFSSVEQALAQHA
jgi:anti-sigma B factor antagonist